MTAVERIKARVAELQGIRDRYLAYQQDRVNERDHHGAWDVAVNLSETECEISGLEFALKAMEETDQCRHGALLQDCGMGCQREEGPRPRKGRIWLDSDNDGVVFSIDGASTAFRRVDVLRMLGLA